METSITKSDFDKICRICLSLKNSMESIHEQDISTRLYNCTGLQISENDGLPNLICEDCRTQVQKSFNFKQLCTDSQQILLQILNCDIAKPTKTPLPSSNLETDVKGDTNCDNLETYKPAPVQEIQSIDSSISTSNNNKESQIPTVVCNGKVKLNSSILHQRVHKRLEKRYKCVLCSKIYRCAATLKRHKLQAHKTESNVILENGGRNNPYTCLDCGKICVNNAKLRRHQIIHKRKEDRFYICSVCKKTFTREDTLRCHLKNYHGDKPFTKKVCNICGKSFTDVRTHMIQKHSAERPHKCAKCDKAFPFKCQLLKHIHEKHDGNKLSYNAQCSTCGKCFRTAGQLKRHMQSHAEDRLYECNLCDKKYKQSATLKKHLKCHADIRPYKCTYCTKSFFTKQILENHIRTHTGERPFSCNICSRAFSQKTSLTIHLRIHQA